METTSTEELASCLRAWRERVSPADVGLPPGGQRRVPGLRREEVAQLAGVSMDYLNRLEQGRASRPSVSVLGSLARALRLSDIERDHLFRLAGQPLPCVGVIDTHIPAPVQRLMDRLADVPLIVQTAAGETIARNALGSALFPEWGRAESRRERTLAWREFTGMSTIRVYTSDEERDENEQVLVADLQRAAADYPADTFVAELIADLRRESPRFEELWNGHQLRGRHAAEKHFDHPEVGPLILDCTELKVEACALKLVVFTPVPGSPSAQALELLGAIGLQSFGTPEAEISQ